MALNFPGGHTRPILSFVKKIFGSGEKRDFLIFWASFEDKI